MKKIVKRREPAELREHRKRGGEYDDAQGESRWKDRLREALLAAVLAWLWLARRVRGGARLRARAMAGFLALVLAEELDWGGVYGLPAIGVRLDAAVGRGSVRRRSCSRACCTRCYLLSASA